MGKQRKERAVRWWGVVRVWRMTPLGGDTKGATSLADIRWLTVHTSMLAAYRCRAEGDSVVEEAAEEAAEETMQQRLINWHLRPAWRPVCPLRQR